jgi:hypothetical protein
MMTLWREEVRFLPDDAGDDVEARLGGAARAMKLTLTLPPNVRKRLIR